MAQLPDPTTTVPGLGFNSFILGSENKTMVSDLNSGNTVSVQIAGHRWKATVGFPEHRFDSKPGFVTRSFIRNLRGKLKTFEIAYPNKQTATGISLADTSAASITANQKGGTLTIANWNTVLVTIGNSVLDSSLISSGYITAGDIFSLSSSPKVYEVISASYNSTSGVLDLEIFPNLVETTSGVDTIQFNNVLYSMKLMEDSYSENLTVEGRYSAMTLSMKESF